MYTYVMGVLNSFLLSLEEFRSNYVYQYIKSILLNLLSMTVWKCLLLTSQHDNYLPWLVLLPIICPYLVNCWINFYWLLRTQLNPRKITNLIWQINFFHQTCQRRGRIFNNKTHNLSSYYHTNIFDFYIFVPFLPRPKCERLRL